MSELSPILPPPLPGSPSTPRGAGVDQLHDPREVADGRVLAAIGYFIWIVALVVLIVRNNAFALYHAKQAIAMSLVHMLLSIPLMCIFFCVMLASTPSMPPPGSSQAPPPAGFLCGILGFWGFSMLLGFWGMAMVILGLVNCINGKAKPLPFYGWVADKLFGRVQKKQS